MLRSQVADVNRLQAELAHEQSEKKKIQLELYLVTNKAEGYAQQLAQERGSLQGENHRSREEQMRMVEETRQKLEDERKMHANTLKEEQEKHVEKVRATGVL